MLYDGFDNLSDYFNYHYNRIKKEKYLSQKYLISKNDLDFLYYLMENSFDSNNPMVNKLYGETIKNWLLNHISYLDVD